MKLAISWFGKDYWEIYDRVSRQMLDDLKRAINESDMMKVHGFNDLKMQRKELWVMTETDDAPEVKENEFRTEAR